MLHMTTKSEILHSTRVVVGEFQLPCCHMCSGSADFAFETSSTSPHVVHCLVAKWFDTSSELSHTTLSAYRSNSNGWTIWKNHEDDSATRVKKKKTLLCEHPPSLDPKNNRPTKRTSQTVPSLSWRNHATTSCSARRSLCSTGLRQHRPLFAPSCEWRVVRGLDEMCEIEIEIDIDIDSDIHIEMKWHGTTLCKSVPCSRFQLCIQIPRG